MSVKSSTTVNDTHAKGTIDASVSSWQSWWSAESGTTYQKRGHDEKLDIADITGDIMKLSQIKKSRKELTELRRNFRSYPSATLRTLAKALGREEEKRGKEPTWVRKLNPTLSPPLSIPNHSAEIKAGTARNIIDQLLADCDEWDIHLMEEQDDGSDDCEQ